MTNRTPTFIDTGWEDYLYWQGRNKKTLRRINELIKASLRSPFEGMGKPEPLRENLSGLWSRRIDDVNRLVVEITDIKIAIIACHYHYWITSPSCGLACPAAPRIP